MIEGVNLILDFITPEQEQDLLKHIPRTPHNRMQKDRNNITRYGATQAYDNGVADKTIPPHLSQWHDQFQYNNVSINEYHPGQMITYHIDNPQSGDTIRVLSLEGDAVMSLRRKGKGERETQVMLPARSLVELSGTARYDYEHQIEKLSAHRYGIVFRNS